MFLCNYNIHFKKELRMPLRLNKQPDFSNKERSAIDLINRPFLEQAAAAHKIIDMDNKRKQTQEDAHIGKDIQRRLNPFLKFWEFISSFFESSRYQSFTTNAMIKNGLAEFIKQRRGNLR
jgi:hypothetical protein